MTAAAASAALAPALLPFEGKPVIATTIIVKKAGDGLSAAVSVDPVELHHGQKVYVVLETEVGRVQFDPSKDSPDMLIRGQVLITETATIVPKELVIELLTQQRLRIEAAREAAQGVQQLVDDKGQSKDVLGDTPAVGDGTAVSRALGEPQPGTDDDGFYDPANDPDAVDVPAALDAARAKRDAKKAQGK